MLRQTLTRLRSPAYKKFAQYEKRLMCRSGIRLLSTMNNVTPVQELMDVQVKETKNISPCVSDLITLWKDTYSCDFASENVGFSASIGVRASLFTTLKMFKKLGYRLIIPKDIYPVYAQLAQLVELEYTTYDTISKKTQQIVVDDVMEDALNKDIMLITDPTPIDGNSLTILDIKKLSTWVKENDRRMVLIDSVYSPEFNRNYTHLLNTEQAIQYFSLSKTHALPLTFGVTILPKKFKHEFDLQVEQPTQIELAYTMLKTYPYMGKEQHDIFKKTWKMLKFDERPSYYSIVQKSHKDTLDEGDLTIPPVVFDSDDTACSVISCLAHLINTLPFTKNMYHVTALSNFAKAFDKYSGCFDKIHIPQSTFKNKVHLLPYNEIGIGLHKVKNILKNSNTEDMELIMCTQTRQRMFATDDTGLGYYIKDSRIKIHRLYIQQNKKLKEISIEDAYAMSLRINSDNIHSYQELLPRSISILPVAIGCQARCPFCFSHSSISDDTRQKRLDDDRVASVLDAAHKIGAIRAVISGGGEPMMLPFDRLLKIIQECSHRFPKTILITNGYALGKLDNNNIENGLRSLDKAGLNVLAISRHGINSINNAQIMHLDTKSDQVAKIFKKGTYVNLCMRWVCVLQKGGVENEDTLTQYLNWAVSTSVTQICFKELYVSSIEESLYYQKDANVWSRNNRVPLSLLVDFLEKNKGIIVARLPWGPPVYKLVWKGIEITIAAYTEPSVYWERSNNICRSWNLMADGDCYASLEDKQSFLEI